MATKRHWGPFCNIRARSPSRVGQTQEIYGGRGKINYESSNHSKRIIFNHLLIAITLQPSEVYWTTDLPHYTPLKVVFRKVGFFQHHVNFTSSLSTFIDPDFTFSVGNWFTRFLIFSYITSTAYLLIRNRVTRKVSRPANSFSQGSQRKEKSS